jgi:hypothetical protein
MEEIASRNDLIIKGIKIFVGPSIVVPLMAKLTSFC